MPVSITANAPARYAQTSLVKQNDAISQGTLRMSTGQRILSAADDAAAMAIGTSLRIENSGLKSALLNATSGTSMLQIADGALGQISELITRLQTLAVQSSSGQYDDATRVLLDGEFQGLKQEIDRLAYSTTFNNVPMLAGGKDYLLASGSSMVTDGVKGVRFDQQLVTGDQSFRYSYDAATERLTLSRVDGGTTTSQTINLTPLLNGSVGVGVNLQGSQALEVGFSQLGVTITLGNGFVRGTNINNPLTSNPGANITVATPTFAAAATNIKPTTVADLALVTTAFNPANGALTLPITASGAGGTVTLDAIPGISYKVGAAAIGTSGAASDDLVGAGTNVEVYVDAADGTKTLLGTMTVGAVAATAAGTGNFVMDVGGGLLTATDSGNIAPTHLTYKVGTGVVSGQDTIGVDVPAMTLEALKLTTLSLTTQINADDAISKLKDALTVLNQGRATVGAQQLRLESVARNLGVISDNNEAARSSLIDVDVSVEISEITSNQAMMQASIAMLSRANQIPDILLGLLK